MSIETRYCGPSSSEGPPLKVVGVLSRHYRSDSFPWKSDVLKTIICFNNIKYLRETLRLQSHNENTTETRQDWGRIHKAILSPDEY